MTTKQLPIRHADVCAACHMELAAGTTAWWDSTARKVTCVSCHDASTEGAPSETPLETDDESKLESPSIDMGEAGKSAHEMFQHLHDERVLRIDAKFGRLAGLVTFLTDDPQSITAWQKGSEGERALAASLMKNLGDHAIVLNDRRVPHTRGNIDHLVIASSGVWVIDAKNYSGLVQKRDVGGFFKVDIRIYVGGRDRSKLINGLSWQISSVKKALGEIEVPVASALCFTDAEWKLLAKPFMLRGALVTWPSALARRIAEPGPLTKDAVKRVAEHLSAALPSKT